MIHLTKNEQGVLIVLAIVMLCGSFLNGVFQKVPGIASWLDEQEEFHHRVDVNVATFDELVRVPYIGEKSARRIIDHREGGGRIHSWEEFKLITGLYPSSFEKASQYLRI